MIKLRVTGRHFDLDDKIQRHVEKKIGGLDKYVPKSLGVIDGQVVLEHDKSNRENNDYCCEVILNVPGEKVQAKEGMINMFAAVDVVEQKLKIQLLKIKDKHEPARNRRRRLVGKLFKPEDTEASSST